MEAEWDELSRNVVLPDMVILLHLLKNIIYVQRDSSQNISWLLHDCDYVFNVLKFDIFRTKPFEVEYF